MSFRRFVTISAGLVALSTVLTSCANGKEGGSAAVEFTYGPIADKQTGLVGDAIFLYNFRGEDFLIYVNGEAAFLSHADLENGVTQFPLISNQNAPKDKVQVIHNGKPCINKGALTGTINNTGRQEFDCP